MANGKSHPGFCTHPLYAVVAHPTEPGKSLCLQCDTVGTVMTKTAGGMLVPKVDLGRPS